MSASRRLITSMLQLREHIRHTATEIHYRQAFSNLDDLKEHKTEFMPAEVKNFLKDWNGNESHSGLSENSVVERS